MTLADDVIRACGRFKYPSGPKAGEPVNLVEHERAFVRGALADGVRQAALTMPRGNSKTGLLAMLATLTIKTGAPLLRMGSDVMLAAASINQGAVAFRDIEFHLSSLYRDWPKARRERYQVMNSPTQCYIRNKPANVELRVAGSNPDLAHGKRLSFALLDEPAKWGAATSERMYNAVRTALGKIPGGRLCAIGTQSENQGMWFQRLLRSDSPSVFNMAFVGDKDADPALESTWLPCNPLAPHNEVLREQLEDESKDLANPEAMASFRALRLNLGTYEVMEGEPLIDMEKWDALPTHDGLAGSEYVLGIDVGASQAMTAAAAVNPDGLIECFAAFGSSRPLADRAQNDGVGTLYQDALAAGELYVCHHPIPDVGELVRRAVERWGQPHCVVADIFRKRELVDAVESYCNPGTNLDFQNSPDDAHANVSLFRELVATSLLSTPRYRLLRHALKAARAHVANSGLRKLARAAEAGRNPKHRDDTAAATILAATTAHRLTYSPATNQHVLQHVNRDPETNPHNPHDIPHWSGSSWM